MDTLQFRVLPLGSLVALVTITWLALGIWRRRRRGLSDAGWATLLGIVVAVCHCSRCSSTCGDCPTPRHASNVVSRIACGTRAL